MIDIIREFGKTIKVLRSTMPTTIVDGQIVDHVRTEVFIDAHLSAAKYSQTVNLTDSQRVRHPIWIGSIEPIYGPRLKNDHYASDFIEHDGETYEVISVAHGDGIEHYEAIALRIES